jgi:hypothetical protein
VTHADGIAARAVGTKLGIAEIEGGVEPQPKNEGVRQLREENQFVVLRHQNTEGKTESLCENGFGR